jgi:hypothetical protein
MRPRWLFPPIYRVMSFLCSSQLWPMHFSARLSPDRGTVCPYGSIVGDPVDVSASPARYDFHETSLAEQKRPHWPDVTTFTKLVRIQWIAPDRATVPEPLNCSVSATRCRMPRISCISRNSAIHRALLRQVDLARQWDPTVIPRPGRIQPDRLKFSELPGGDAISPCSC